MKERQWLMAAAPLPMIGFLGRKITQRKRRLLSCACCRRIWGLLTDGRSRRAVEAAERYADGDISRADLQTAYQDAAKADFHLNHIMARVAPREDRTAWKHWKASLAAKHAAALQGTADAIEHAAGATFVDLAQLAAECKAQAGLVRDIFGNPFRTVAFDPAWRTSAAVQLAARMYEARDFALMPILADALQDAGCDAADVLAHCRDPQAVHVRGCWVVDLVLGKG